MNVFLRHFDSRTCVNSNAAGQRLTVPPLNRTSNPTRGWSLLPYWPYVAVGASDWEVRW